ncbi:hypothetical protein BDL97_06G112500 [Sphagnum fallax]|nr:hypothetical protein BDL97_06G112500 [Sphagnum fallax]
MQQETTLFMSSKRIPRCCISKLGDLSHKDLTAHTLLVRTILNSLCCYFPAQHLISKTRSSPHSGHIVKDSVLKSSARTDFRSS